MKGGLSNYVVKGIWAIQWDQGFTRSVSERGTRPPEILKFCGSLTLQIHLELYPMSRKTSLVDKPHHDPLPWQNYVSYYVSYFVLLKMITINGGNIAKICWVPGLAFPAKGRFYPKLTVSFSAFQEF